jgi:hypothetical protein
MNTQDIIIRWPDGKKHLDKIIRSGKLYLFNQPRHFNPKVNKIGIVQEGKIKITFKVEPEIKKITSALVPDPKINGVFNKRKANLFTIVSGSLKTTNITPNITGFRAFGAIRYLNINKNKSELIDKTFGGEVKNYVDAGQYNNKFEFRSKPFEFGHKSKNRQQVEKNLIDDYVKYCNISNSIIRPYIAIDSLYADLFDKSKWRLYEVKTKTDRKTLREAVGQLYDYKRLFKRKPSLGILLPSKPSASIIQFLSYYRITVIWKSGKKFSDSRKGAWSTPN